MPNQIWNKIIDLRTLIQNNSHHEELSENNEQRNPSNNLPDILEEELPELRSGYTESLTMSCKEGDFVLSGGWIAYDTSSNFTLVPLSSGPVTDDS